jgi:hypothetical protein
MLEFALPHQRLRLDYRHGENEVALILLADHPLRRQQPDIAAKIGSFQFSICETSPPALQSCNLLYFIGVGVQQKLLSV